MQKFFTLARRIGVMGPAEHERLRAAAANSNVALEMVNGEDRRVHTLIVTGEMLRRSPTGAEMARH
ncbi:MAG: hypothetical protein ABL866_08845 [Devosia sp.]